MIRFTYPDQQNKETLFSLCPDGERGELARSLIEELMRDEEDESDIAVCFCYGTFIVRRFFDEYEFTFPLELEKDADVEQALSSVEEYCKRYEFPLIFCDLTDTEQIALSKRYRLSRTEEFDISEEGESPQWIYRMRVLSPCDVLDAPPEICDEELTLNALREEDIPTYATLCRDEEILAVWGVDYRETSPDMTDRDFFEGVLDEFERGISLTLAIRVGGRLIGEVALYAFDGKGGAEFSIRILRGYRRCGYAMRALSLLFSLAREELSLDYVEGICLCENTPSKCLMEKCMTLEEQSDEMMRFCKNLR